jgi:hypothetical protein
MFHADILSPVSIDYPKVSGRVYIWSPIDIYWFILACTWCSKSTSRKPSSPSLQASGWGTRSRNICCKESHGILWSESIMWFQYTWKFQWALSHGITSKWHGETLEIKQRWVDSVYSKGHIDIKLWAHMLWRYKLLLKTSDFQSLFFRTHWLR